jgi:hypothetical protein
VGNAGKQVLVVVGILGFTAGFGGLSYGIRAAGIGHACGNVCEARGQELVDVEYRVGKTDHDSICVCSQDRIHTKQADMIATLSVIVPIILTFVLTGAFLMWLSRRANPS